MYLGRAIPLVWLVLALLSGCQDELFNSRQQNGFRYPPSQAYRVTIPRGVWGQVWFWEGDFMPVVCPEGDCYPNGRITPVKRKLFIHQLTTFDQVEPVDSPAFFAAIHTPLIGTTWSDKLGFFQIELPPGRYSFFVLEDSLFYANGSDGNGHILPVEVKPDSVSMRQIDITYRATF